MLLFFAISSIVIIRNVVAIQEVKEEKQVEEAQLKEENYNSIYTWPSSGLSRYLPKPDSPNGIIENDTKEIFEIEVYKVSFDEYKNYVENCKNTGFSLYTTEYNKTFTAYNEDEYVLNLYYFDENERLAVNVKAPYEIAKITWPKSDLVKFIPKPSSSEGHIFFENDTEISVLIANITKEQYIEYVDKCMKKGFDVDYSRGEKVFEGNNKKEYSLRVESRPFDKMYISLKK